MPTLQSALKDGFGEAVMACNMPQPCEFLSPDRCQKRFLRANKEVDLASHRALCLVPKVGDAEKFPQALDFESLDPFLRVSRYGPCLSAIEEEGGDKRFVQFPLLAKLMVFLHWLA